MPEHRSIVLRAVFRALRHLDETLGPDDPATIEVKRIVLESLVKQGLVDADDPRDLLSLLPNDPTQSTQL